MIKQIEGEETYEVIEKIGEGGMGTIFKARKLGSAGFEKIVAIKMLKHNLAGDQKSIDSFVTEAKLVANLIHENIVQIYQLGTCVEGYYFALEFVDGISLYDLMLMHARVKQMVPQTLAVFIASRVARGLAYAHSRRDGAGHPMGIVHCDICPHNIMINSEGVTKITDFGIARFANRGDFHYAGKLGYMSPEQARNEELDFRSDLYSLGVVLFFLLSGQLPRNNKGSLTGQLEDARNNVVDWERLPDDLPVTLLEILDGLLATDPDDRYDDTSLLARELEYFIYKDGYGPTIVTLADYLREFMPARFGLPGEQGDEEDYPLPEHTIKITEDIGSQKQTLKLPPEFFN